MPPPELLVCPADPKGFPVDQLATMPEPVRAAAMRLATAYAAARQQLERLVAWNTGKTCAEVH